MGFGESYVMTIGDGVMVINLFLDHLRCMGIVHKLCQFESENMKIKCACQTLFED